MQTFFRDYIKKNPPKGPEVYELKICKGTSLPFDAVREHQAKALLSATTGLFHKLIDPPIFYGGKTRFNAPRPFDCFYLSNVPGFVIIWFYHPRQPKVFCKIPIQQWLNEQVTCGRKSIPEKRAEELGELLYLQ